MIHLNRNIRSGTDLDRIIDACDKYDQRGDCATGIACFIGALMAGRSIYYEGRPVTVVVDHMFLGPQNCGKSTVLEALERATEALDVPTLTEWLKSYPACANALHEVMQRRVEPENKSDKSEPPQYQILSKRAAWILDEAGALARSQGHGDAAAMAVEGVQVCINMAASGIVGRDRAETRANAGKWPKIKGATVMAARFSQLQNGAALLARTRVDSNGAERRQGVWTVKLDTPLDAHGNPLPPGPELVEARSRVFRECFDLEQLEFVIGDRFGARMTAALKADLDPKAPQKKVIVCNPQDRAIYQAVEAAAHGDPVWSMCGGNVAYTQAIYWAGVRAWVRDASTTNDDDWRWAVQIVDRIHANADAVLEEQDSEPRQVEALDEVRRHFARTPYFDSTDAPRTRDRRRDVLQWVGRSKTRQWAFWTWGLCNLVYKIGQVSGRREICIYRRREPIEWGGDCPFDAFQEGFNGALEAAQNRYGPPSPFAAQDDSPAK